jgi:hypothetical protein
MKEQIRKRRPRIVALCEGLAEVSVGGKQPAQQRRIITLRVSGRRWGIIQVRLKGNSYGTSKETSGGLDTGQVP